MDEYVREYVAMTVAMLKADGKIGTTELGVIRYLGLSYGMENDQLSLLIKQEMERDASIEDVAATIDDEKCKNMILESCAVVALADKRLDEKEIELLLRISTSLGVSAAKTMLAIAKVVQNDKDIFVAEV